ncbi:uncharacterized protein ACWYII_039560 [Salvelinus alpinus]
MITCVFLQKQQSVKSVNGYYQLTGVVSHLGGAANSGHYISDILNASGYWFCCNDSQVSMSNEATVLRSRARSAYLLFYMFRRAGGTSTQGLTGPHAPASASTGAAPGPAFTPQAQPQNPQPSLNRGSTSSSPNTPSPASTWAAPGPASTPPAQPQQGQNNAQPQHPQTCLDRAQEALSSGIQAGSNRKRDKGKQLGS